MKQCTKCHQIKKESAFCKHACNKDGLNYWCKKCATESSLAWHYTRDKKLLNKQRCLRRYQQLSTIEGRRRLRLNRLLIHARKRARKKNLSYDLDFKWIDQHTPDMCPIFKIPFRFNTLNEKKWLDCPSIDRIDNEKGYTKDNCIIISRKANVIKNMATIKELIQVGDFYKQFNH